LSDLIWRLISIFAGALSSRSPWLAPPSLANGEEGPPGMNILEKPLDILSELIIFSAVVSTPRE